MSWVDRLLERTAVYRLWQAPFAEAKFAPVRRHNDIGQARRVLDVGCGPGTNTRYFAHAEYLGLDINPAYVEHARRLYGRSFIVADATTYTVPAEQRYDWILLNSFLHHVETGDVRRILSHLATLLTPDGHIHILDLVLPAGPSAARLLARWDRGKYARPLAEWRGLFTESFVPVVFESYPLGAGSLVLWNMVYFKGRARG
jgi:SAM-dependent methyltransferase